MEYNNPNKSATQRVHKCVSVKGTTTTRGIVRWHCERERKRGESEKEKEKERATC